MVERQLPKLHTRVRFPSPAPPCIGGATPSLPTVTRLATSFPSAFFVAPNTTVAPGFRSSAPAANTKVPIGAPGGTTILLLSLFGSAATFMATIRFR
jgi:hypothetical protein